MDIRLDDGTIIRNVPDGMTKEQVQAKLDAKRARDSGTSISDYARALASGVNRIGSSLAGMADNSKIGDMVRMIEGTPTREEAMLESGGMPLSKKLRDAYLAKLTPEKRAEIEKAAAEYAKANPLTERVRKFFDSNAGYWNSGMTEGAKAKRAYVGEGSDIVDTLRRYKNEPQAALLAAVENTPQIGLAMATKNAPASSRAVINAGVEAAMNGEDARQGVLDDASKKFFADGDNWSNLKGVDPAAAIIASNEANKRAIAATLLLSPIGAASEIAALRRLGGQSPIKGAEFGLKQIPKQAWNEAVEEFGQESLSKVAQNKAIADNYDPSVGLLDGAGVAGVHGAVAGGVMGAGRGMLMVPKPRSKTGTDTGSGGNPSGSSDPTQDQQSAAMDELRAAAEQGQQPEQPVQPQDMTQPAPAQQEPASGLSGVVQRHTQSAAPSLDAAFSDAIQTGQSPDFTGLAQQTGIDRNSLVDQFNAKRTDHVRKQRLMDLAEQGDLNALRSAASEITVDPQQQDQLIEEAVAGNEQRKADALAASQQQVAQAQQQAQQSAQQQADKDKYDQTYSKMLDEAVAALEGGQTEVKAFLPIKKKYSASGLNATDVNGVIEHAKQVIAEKQQKAARHEQAVTEAMPHLQSGDEASAVLAMDKAGVTDDADVQSVLKEANKRIRQDSKKPAGTQSVPAGQQAAPVDPLSAAVAEVKAAQAAGKKVNLATIAKKHGVTIMDVAKGVAAKPEQAAPKAKPSQPLALPAPQGPATTGDVMVSRNGKVMSQAEADALSAASDAEKKQMRRDMAEEAGNPTGIPTGMKSKVEKPARTEQKAVLPHLILRTDGKPFPDTKQATRVLASKKLEDTHEVVSVEGGKAIAPKKAVTAKNQVDPEKDDILTAIAKLGGIDREQAKRQGIDPADFSRRAGGIQFVFRKNGGKELDRMAEALSELGYPVTENGDYTVNALLDSLDAALRGSAVGTPQFHEAKAQAMYEEEAAQREIDATFDSPGNSAEPDWLSFGADDFVSSILDGDITPNAVIASELAGIENERTVTGTPEAVGQKTNANPAPDGGAKGIAAAAGGGTERQQKGKGDSQPDSAVQDFGLKSQTEADLRADDLMGLPKENRKTLASWAGSTPVGGSEKIKVYRSIVPGSGQETLRPGDWVSASRDYIKDYAENESNILEYEIQAFDLVDAQTGALPLDTLIWIPNGYRDANEYLDEDGGLRKNLNNPTFSLVSQTEAERAAEEARVRAALDAKTKEDEQARLKAQADREISSFTLTGSDLPADVAMAAGQKDLFAPRTRGEKEAEKNQPRSDATISDADYAQVVEAAKYLKDIVYSMDNLVGDDTNLLIALSSDLGKSGRDTILMDAFGIDRSLAHTINNRLDDRKPHKLRAVDMGDAFTTFPMLRKVVDDAKDVIRKRDERRAARDAESKAASQQAMAVAPEVAAVESKPDPVKWFGSRDKAEAWIAKVSKVNGGAYHVVQAGPSRFEVFSGKKPAAPVEPNAFPIGKDGKPLRKAIVPLSQADALIALMDGNKIIFNRDTEYQEEIWLEENTARNTWVVKTRSGGAVVTEGPVGPARNSGWTRNDAAVKAIEGKTFEGEVFGSENNKAPAKPAEDIDAMFDDVLAEVTGKAKSADSLKESVESAFTGEPDPKNSAPMQELDGFAVGDKVSIANRSVSEGVIRQLFTRQSAGGEMSMARVEVAGGKTLDLLIDNLSIQERTAGQSAASAAKNTGMALGEAIDGLGKLFGGKGTLGSGLVFDEETYAKAKPYFIAAISHLKAAGSDLREAMRAVVKMVVDKFGVDAAGNMKPYVVQFIADVRDGKIDDPAATLSNSDTKEATGNDVRKLDTTGAGSLEGVSSGEVQGTGASRGTGSGVTEGGRGNGGTDGSVAGAGSDRNGGMGDSSERVPVPGAGAGGSGRGRSRSSGGNGRAVSAQPAAGNEQVNAGGLTADANQPSEALEPGRIDPPQLPDDFIIEEDFALGEGGQRTKYKNNVEAIRLIRDLEATGRTATTDEQKVLAKYVGWGGIPQAFDPDNKDWSAQYAELKSLLSADEWDAAFESTQYAHYTSREIINGMYAAVRRLGFTGGSVLEAGGGVGNFIGLMPVDLRTNGKVTLVERENIAAAIARHLYPRQNVRAEDFTEFGKGQDGQYDMQIGNPPFSSNPLTDQSGRKHLTGLSVHNYFIAKGVDMLREGGIMAVVVSNSFMDAGNARAREYIAKRAKLLGAIRLPNNAFSKNANTQVTTDIIFLQKLPESAHGSKAAIADGKRWVGVTTVSDPQGKGEVALNQYFADNRSMMLGEWGKFGTMYGPDQPALVARPGQDTGAMLMRAIAAMPEGVYTPASVSRTKAMEGALLEKLHDKTVDEGGFYVNDGKLWRRVADSAGEEYAAEITPNTVISGTRPIGQSGVDRLRQLAELRRTMRELLAAETEDRKADMDRLRKDLNSRYDAYVADNGRINDPTTKRLMRDDPDYPLIAALEMDYEPGIGPAAAKAAGIKPQTSKSKKAAIFNQRVIEARKAVTKADSPQDAINISMAERGRLDAEYIGRLLDVPADEVLGQLASGAEPLLFRDPATGEYVLRDAYLSGNVREKLKQAKAAGLTSNVRALEAVQPEDIPASKISVRIGSPWVPVGVYADFATSLFGDGTKTILRYVKSNGGFSGVIIPGSEVMASTKYGIKSYHGDAILLALMNNRQIKVMTKDGDGKPTVDAKATEEANSKADDIKQAFQDWIFKDADRAEVLVRAYNDANNNYVVRKYDGSWLKFPGKVPDAVIRFRRHQRNAIARTIQDRTTLYDHVVGAGKTFTAIASAMEMRRMGLIRKPLMVVPNHLVGQWASDFYRLYPGAKVLAATKKDFDRENRRRFLAKIASGDWDAVIIAHSSFERIRPSPEFEQKFTQAEIDRIMREAKEVDASDGDEQQKKRTVKQLAAMQERLENRIAKLREKPMDDLLDFQQLGVDQLFVDEAHLFKNLMFTTKMQNVRGLGDPTGSQRAYDMYIKTNQIMEQNGRGQGVAFMTGTPVSNSLAEMYHMMRYLMPEQMRQLGFESFDAWANTYASVNQVWMQTAGGDGFKAQNRMSNFDNVPELLRLFDQVSDTVTMDDIKAAFKEETGKDFPLPKLLTGRRQPVSLDKTPAQEAYMKDIIDRLKRLELRKGPPRKGEDNHLTIMSDARKAAMDIRLVDMAVIDREKGARVDRASDEIFARWKKYDADRGTQLVFADLGTPISTVKNEVKEYDAIMARISAGEDPDTIAMAQLGDEEAAAKVNDAESAREELDAKGKDWLTAIEGAKRGFSVYDDLKKALMEKGIPENQIAFIHSYNTDDQKAALFRKVNSGEIRILMGSTAKMGAGTNVQRRLVALHHLDVPWKPSDLEQREGRIIRQGNELADKNPDFEVEILAYVTKDTLDMRMWQIQEVKLKMINQLRTRSVDRELENAFEDMEMSAGEMQAAATGNMDMLREIQLRTEVQKLEKKQRAFDAGKADAIAGIRRATREIDRLPAQIAAYERLSKASEDVLLDVFTARNKFKATINGKEYSNHTEAAKVLRDLVDAVEVGDDGKERKAKLDVSLNGEQFTNRQKLAEAFARLTGDNEPFVFDAGDGKVYRVDDAADAVMDTVASARDSDGEKLLGNMGDYKVSIEYSGEVFGGNFEEFDVHASVGDDDLPSAVVRAKPGDDRHTAKEILKAVRNMVRDAGSALSSLKASLEKAKKNLADLSKIDTTSEWPDSDKLARMREEHKALRDKMNKEAEANKEQGKEQGGELRMSVQSDTSGPGLTTTTAREILAADPVLSKAMPFIELKVGEIVPAGAAKFLPAYHGSPYKFDKFSLDHIGKGEGAQAYGWGLYFAGSKEIGDWYRSVLSKPVDGEVFFKGKAYDYSVGSDSVNALVTTLAEYYGMSRRVVSGAVMAMREHHGATPAYSYFTHAMDEKTKEQKDIHALLTILRNEQNTSTGQLYHVDIPEDGTYLLWDKPLSEQPDYVTKRLTDKRAAEAFAKYASRNKNLMEYIGESKFDGRQAYESLAIAMGSQEKASKFLGSLGISGIKFLDGPSRSKGDGNHNYVVFDDKAVRILETYYSAGKSGGPEGYYHNGKITLFPENIKATPTQTAEERLKWVAFHEITHRGVANLAESQAYLSELERAGKNPYVKNLAKKIYDARQLLDEKYHVSMEVATEEALAEINAALRTGNVKQIKEQYGLHFPLSIRPRAKSAVARFIESVKRIINRMFGRGLTDAQVENLLRRTNDAGMTPDGGPGRGRDYDAAVFSLADKGDGSPTEAALAEARRQLEEQLAIADRMIAERGGLFAPNGEKSKLNRHQWAQVRTANFKKWFGDWENDPDNASKVVDENGEPMVVYHGTGAEFDAFDPRKSADVGMHFGTAEQANTFAGLRTIPAFLKARNPLVLDFDPTVFPAEGYGDYFSDNLKRVAYEFGDTDIMEAIRAGNVKADRAYEAAKKADRVARKYEEEGDFRDFKEDPSLKKMWMALEAYVRSKGFDGVFYENELEGEGVSYSVFAPNQIKSATGNAGTFSGKTDDIRYSPSPKDWITEQGRITKRVLSKEVAQRDLTLWQKTLGTPLNAALKNPAFKKVYDLAQRLIQHVNNDAYDSLNAAPDVLSRLENWNDYKRDIANTVKEAGAALTMQQSKRRKDMAAAAEVLFEGTRFDKKVYSDEELDAFKLTADQKEIYRQARAAIDKSVGNAGKSQALNVAMNAEAINWATVERLVNMDLDPEVLFSEVSDLIDARIAATKMEAENSTSEAEIKKLDKQAEKLAAALASISEIQAIVEKSATEGYAPLMRWGKYTVTVIDPVDGKTLRFHMLESKREQAALELKLREKYGDANVVGDVLDEGKFEQFKGITPETVALFASVTGMDQDAAYQEYLKLAIPGRSALKRKIHRKGDMGEGIEGFSTDLPRVLSSFVLSNARKSARDLYRGPINDAIKDIKVGGGVAEKARELAKFVMEPDENDWSVGIRNMLFVWNMGASVAFGVLNLSQPWMMTLPWLSQFQDPVSATGTMAKAAKLAASAQASGKAPKGYEAEYSRAVREGVVDPQNVFMLQGVERGKSGVGTNIWRNVAHGMGLIASATESMNRKLTLIAALDVARAKGDDWLKSKGFADAYDFAKRAVDETQGVYNKGNRPAWARNPALAVILVFKQYSINWVEMASRMASNHYGDDRYRKGFWMLVGALFMMAGGMGLPGVGDMIDMIETSMSLAGKPVNVERQMQMALGKDLYEPLMYGPVNSLLFNPMGADMFGRMSMGNMIPATAVANPGLTWAARSDEAVQALGAGAGLASKFVDSYNMAATGNVGQALINASPRAVTSVAKAVEMATTNQYKDSKGRTVRSVTPAEALIKGLDLQPASVARIQRERSRRFKDEAIQAQAKTEIRNELIDAYESGDQDAIDAANNRLRTWNDENPLYPVHINRRALRKTVRERGKNWSARDESPKGMEWLDEWIPESSK